MLEVNSEGEAMTEEEWLSNAQLYKMFQLLGRAVTRRKMRLLACACCRRFEARLTDTDLAALSLVERYVDGNAWKGELPTGLSRFHQTGSLAQAVHLTSHKHASNASLRTAINRASLFVARTSRAEYDGEAVDVEQTAQRDLLRDIFGNPFRTVACDPAWLTSDVVALARGIYDDRAFDRMPILADALQDAGCANDEVLNHCRDANQIHVRGCWVVDLLLGKS
jgi:hypothetical protein